MQQYYVKKTKKKNYTIVVFLGLFCLIWFVFRSKISPVFQDFYTKVLINNQIMSLFASKNKMQNDLDSLTIRNMQLENDIAHLKFELSQNKIQDEMATKGRVDSIIAYSLGSADNLIYNNFLINVGSASGVQAGAIVYSGGLEPVGIIDKANQNSSVVKLLSSDGNEVNGIIENSDNKITLIGNGGISYTAKIKNKLLDDGVSVGQKIFYGEDVSMTLGTIVNIEKHKDEDMSTIYIKGKYKPDGKAIFFVDK